MGTIISLAGACSNSETLFLDRLIFKHGLRMAAVIVSVVGERKTLIASRSKKKLETYILDGAIQELLMIP